MVSSVQDKLLQYVDEHLPSYLEEWEYFCTQITSSTQHSIIHRPQEALITRLQHRGMNIQLLGEDESIIYAELNTGAPRTLLLYTYYNDSSTDLRHLDTIIAYLATFDVCRQVLGSLPVNIKWLLGGKDSMDDLSIGKLFEQHRELLNADGCIWDSTTLLDVGDNEMPFIALGTKGYLSVEMEVQTAPINIHSMHGAILPNAAWRLTWALNKLKDAREEILIEDFYSTVSSATDDEIALIYSLPDGAASLAKRWGMNELLLGLQGFQLHYAHLLTPACILNSMSSGSRATDICESEMALPTQASARVDFYLVPDQDPHDIYLKLQSHLQVHGFQDIKVRKLYAFQPVRTSIHDPFMKLVWYSTTTAYGYEPVLLPLTVGCAPIYTSRPAFPMPFVVLTMGKPAVEKFNSSRFAASIKQLALIIEGFSLRTTQ